MAVDNARLFRDAEESLAVLDVLATAPVGLAFWDRNHRYVRINDTLAALNGRPPRSTSAARRRTYSRTSAAASQPISCVVLETGEPILNEEVG